MQDAKQPIRQQEYEDLLVSVIAIAAKERAHGDPVIAKAFVDRWIKLAADEHVKRLLAKRQDETLEGMQPCGHC